MKQIKPLALTAENFRDYGTVLHLVEDKEPMNDNAEFKYWGKISTLEMGPVATTGMVYANKREPVVKALERHVNTPEVMIALEGDSVICLAKATGESKEISEVQAFYLRQGEAIAMDKGVWHWVPYPVNCELAKIMTVFASGTEHNDLELVDLAEPVKVEF